MSQFSFHKEVVHLDAADKFERIMSRIGRTHQGPHSTYGGGECALFATLQTLEPDFAEFFCQHASSCMHVIAELRIDVKNVVLDMKCGDVTRKRCVEDTVRTTLAAQASETDQEVIWSSNPDWGEVAEKLGMPVAGMLGIMENVPKMFLFAVVFFDDVCVFAEGGIWFGEVGLRALALVVKEDIVVVNCSTGNMMVYPCFHGAHKMKGPKRTTSSVSQEMGRPCTDRCGNQVTPLTVFKPSTVVLAYNGIHFWYTKIGNPGSIDKYSWLRQCKNQVPKEQLHDVVQEAMRVTSK
jgi:hypothetical protein